MHTGTRVSVRVLCECVRRVRKETHTVRRGKEEVEEHKRGFGLKRTHPTPRILLLVRGVTACGVVCLVGLLWVNVCGVYVMGYSWRYVDPIQSYAIIVSRWHAPVLSRAPFIEPTSAPANCVVFMAHSRATARPRGQDRALASSPDRVNPTAFL